VSSRPPTRRLFLPRSVLTALWFSRELLACGPAPLSGATLSHFLSSRTPPSGTCRLSSSTRFWTPVPTTPVVPFFSTFDVPHRRLLLTHVAPTVEHALVRISYIDCLDFPRRIMRRPQVPSSLRLIFLPFARCTPFASPSLDVRLGYLPEEALRCCFREPRREQDQADSRVYLLLEAWFLLLFFATNVSFFLRPFPFSFSCEPKRNFHD